MPAAAFSVVSFHVHRVRSLASFSRGAFCSGLATAQSGTMTSGMLSFDSNHIIKGLYMEKRKTLLLLGGSKAQLVAIHSAKKLGYRTIVCDYLPHNPGRHLADTFYPISTTDKEAVLDVAREEHIDGIVAYGSDPAAPTAAYVSEKMGLPGMPAALATTFCDKHLFRAFLQREGFNVPQSVFVESDASPKDFGKLLYPLIVKPTDSSGSKGVTVVGSPEELPAALDYAFSKTRGGGVIVEEFIQRDHPHVIEAEIFVVQGKVSSWGLMNSIRDTQTNPLLPAGYTLPLQLSEERMNLVRRETSRLVEVSGVRFGAFNMEMIIDRHERLFFLDVGPRNGGNMLPEFISAASGKDVVKATLRAAVGDYDDLDVAYDGASTGYWGLSVLHARHAGVFAGVSYSDAAKRALFREVLNVSPGDEVRRFSVCTDLVGLSFFHFDSLQHMNDVMEHSDASMRVVVDSAS